MSYTLYGSQTSPFVRRIRMLMENIPFELNELSVFEQKDVEALNKINPLNQVPALKDDEKVIWDSRHIFNYLNLKHSLYELNWEQENLLAAVEGMIDSGVALLLMKRSGINIDEPIMYVERQKNRTDSVLHYLKPMLNTTQFKNWNFVSMTLYSFIDWASFRNIINLEKWPEYNTFLSLHADRPIIKKTAIPKV